ncbi:hypothetical protein [Sphaerisporangium dianthi]|uniref:Phosphatidylserine/phosphatidylglycerophosphate/ cardiolipin synthase family protein n=1 Tax=Sphaerisporangium dianthi TaxID=1436120 RepID=A0ABV9CS01_9ACTN
MNGRALGGPSAEVTSKALRKIIVTVLTGSITFGLTNIIVDQPIYSVILSTFLGGVVYVIQYLVEVDTQLQAVRDEQRRHHGTIEALVRSGFSRISEATELFGLVESSAFRTDVVTQLVRNATQLGPETPELIHDFAQAEIERMSRFFRELGEGNVIHEGEDREWLLGLATNTRSSIDAISLTTVDAGSSDVEGGFWVTDLGQRYLRIQRDLVQRGVRVRRIFILDRSDRLQAEVFRRQYHWQEEISIDVRVLELLTIPTALRSSIFDFIIFDDAVSYEVTPTSWVGDNLGSLIVNTRLVLDDPHIADRKKTFEELWELAAPLG